VPEVEVVRVERQQITTHSDEFSGHIQAIGRVPLVARVTAYLEKRLFVEGSEMKKGDLLYQLEQPPFEADVLIRRANVAQLEAQHRNAELTLQRARRLEQSALDSALASERSLAAEIEAAKGQLEQAEISLGYTEIRAPIDGQISATAATEGSVVSPTSGVLATIFSQDPMYVIFPITLRMKDDLSYRYRGYLAVVIKLRLQNGEIYGQNGILDYIAPTVSESGDIITLRGVIPNPLRAETRPGEPGSRMLVDGEAVTVLLEGVEPIIVLAIPRTAVLSDQQGDFVYVVDAQNEAQARRIQLGKSTPSTAVVTAGLKEGELVITEGLQRVEELQRVRPGLKVSVAPRPAGAARDRLDSDDRPK
jgi:membrane fusion protein (multidrug efflux system)